nr:hypothetical protein [Maliibacterium massiliense]
MEHKYTVTLDDETAAYFLLGSLTTQMSMEETLSMALESLVALVQHHWQDRN